MVYKKVVPSVVIMGELPETRSDVVRAVTSFLDRIEEIATKRIIVDIYTNTDTNTRSDKLEVDISECCYIRELVFHLINLYSDILNASSNTSFTVVRVRIKEEES